jgi:hypothetical protein
MSKNVHVDTWFHPMQDFEPGVHLNRRYLESNLVCSDDDTRAYIREDFDWILFKIDSRKASGAGKFELDCIYVGIVGSQNEAYEYLDGRISKNPPGPAEHYIATGCT